MHSLCGSKIFNHLAVRAGAILGLGSQFFFLLRISFR